MFFIRHGNSSWKISFAGDYTMPPAPPLAHSNSLLARLSLM